MKKILATLLLSAATVTPAIAGPDFVSKTPQPRALATSDSVKELAPLDDVTFELDSAVLADTAQSQLASVATWMKRHPRFKLVLEGYTDSSGRAQYNEDLATRRVAAARSQLVRLGVNGDRIVMVVYGEAAARPGIHPLDRRVVLYATERPAREVAEVSIERKHALNAVWSRKGRLFTETRPGQQPSVIIGSR